MYRKCSRFCVPTNICKTPCEESRSLLGKKRQTNCGSNRGANDVARVAAKQQSSLFFLKNTLSTDILQLYTSAFVTSCLVSPPKKSRNICFHRGLSQISMNCLTLMRKCLSSLGDETKKDKSAFTSLNWLLGSDSLSGKMVHDCVFLFFLFKSALFFPSVPFLLSSGLRLCVKSTRTWLCG